MENIILLRHPKKWGLDEKVILNKAEEALEYFGYREDAELSLWFVGRKKAKDLNIKYRDKDYIPQVLGFPLNKSKDGDGMVRLGDIVICTQKLRYEVKFQKSDLETILTEWMRHGVENLVK